MSNVNILKWENVTAAPPPLAWPAQTATSWDC